MLLAAWRNFPQPDVDSSRDLDDSLVVILRCDHNHQGFVAWQAILVESAGAAGQRDLFKGKVNRGAGGNCSVVGGRRAARGLSGIRLIELPGLFQGSPCLR